MSLENIRSECSEFAALLQPHVDGELADEEQRRVSDHLEGCDACRAAVSEQMWVRATLRSLHREAAPPGLHAQILGALDEADEADAADEADQLDAAAQAAPAAIPLVGHGRGRRARDLLRGGMVMIPAAAVAAGLFFVARGGLEPVQTLPNPGLSAAMSRPDLAHHEPGESGGPGSNDAPALSQLEKLQPRLDFPLQVAPPTGAERVQLVGARLDPTDDHSLGARLRYRVAAHEGNHLVIDRQRPIGAAPPRGAPVVFRGQAYTVNYAESGAPTLHFEHGGVAHMLTLEGASGRSDGAVDVDSPDFAVLLDLAHQLAGEPPASELRRAR